jgi:hypothetical protein
MVHGTMGAPYDVDDTIRLGAPYDMIRIVTFCIPLCASLFFSLKDLPHTQMYVREN